MATEKRQIFTSESNKSWRTTSLQKTEMIYAVVDIQGHLLVVAAILEKQFKKSVFSTTLHYFDIFYRNFE